MRDEWSEGFKACQNDYLTPLQSRLQEIILNYKDDKYRDADEVILEVTEALKASDDKKEWVVS